MWQLAINDWERSHLFLVLSTHAEKRISCFQFTLVLTAAKSRKTRVGFDSTAHVTMVKAGSGRCAKTIFNNADLWGILVTMLLQVRSRLHFLIWKLNWSWNAQVLTVACKFELALWNSLLFYHGWVNWIIKNLYPKDDVTLLVFPKHLRFKEREKKCFFLADVCIVPQWQTNLGWPGISVYQSVQFSIWTTLSVDFNHMNKNIYATGQVFTISIGWCNIGTTLPLTN